MGLPPVAPEQPSPLSEKQRVVLRARAEARAHQAQIEACRLEKHVLVVALMADNERRADLVAAAEVHVARWERNSMCWSGYISAWRNMLAMPVDQMAQIILAPSGDGPALRQNSPFLSVELMS